MHSAKLLSPIWRLPPQPNRPPVFVPCNTTSINSRKTI
uniref:Uncharacterized protein n=1 Tax=Ascaris lumbricoides TaxID=6252 RepID=A0A0M3HHI4_ASCLU